MPCLDWAAGHERPSAHPMRQLLRTMESLQQQQEQAEVARRAADREAQLANEEIAQLELQLHKGEQPGGAALGKGVCIV